MADSSSMDEKGNMLCAIGEPSDVSNENNILKSLSPEQWLPKRPKRPLSAYNFFFREARRKILKNIPDTREKCTMNSRGRHGKISFEDLARAIGVMWKGTNAVERNVYAGLAMEDKRRYDHEMDEWRSIMEGNIGKDQAKKHMKGAPTTGQENFSSTHGKHRSCISFVASAPYPLESPYLPQAALHPMVASHVQSIPIKEASEWPNMDGTVIPSGIEVLMTTLTSNLIYSTGEDTRNSSANTESLSPNMVHNEVSFEKYAFGENKGELDLFCPTISDNYTHDYAWLASCMDVAGIDFLINLFQE